MEMSFREGKEKKLGLVGERENHKMTKIPTKKSHV